MNRLSLLTLLTLLTFLTLLPAGQVGAAPESTPTANVKQIEDLKDRLATKVAELRQSQRRAIAGTVKTVSVSTATIQTKEKDIKVELADDMKIIQYLKGKRTNLTIDDVSKGDRVVVFGQYDATLDLMKAKVIVIENAATQRISGTVTAISKDEYTVTLAAADQKTYVIDIETVTKINLWTDEKGLTKGGFSKMSVGDTIHVVGTAVPKKENRLSAIRILDIGNVASAPVATPTP